MVKQIGFVALMAGLFHTNAAHAEMRVFEKDIQDQSTSDCPLKVDFEVNSENPELGRAWLLAYYDKRDIQDSDGAIPKSMNIMVPGLSYSPDNKQILFKKSDGSKVVCANNVSPNAWFGPKYSETGKCGIELIRTTIVQDNGFTTKKVNGVKITLNIHE